MSAGNVFRLQLNAAIARAKTNVDAVVRKTVIDIGARLIERSPVGDPSYWKHPAPKGYVGGRFRGSWDYAIDQPPAGADAIDASGAASAQRIAAAATAPAARRHFIVNSLPYAQRIEYGWSLQAPQGVVRLTLLEADGIVQEAVRSVKGSE